MSQKIHNRRYLKYIRIGLRNFPTPEEEILWNELKNRKLKGRKFRRQHSIGNFIVDFYCPSEKLVVELDGAHHFTEERKMLDQDRDSRLERDFGLTILRFPNSQVRDEKTWS